MHVKSKDNKYYQVWKQFLNITSMYFFPFSSECQWLINVLTVASIFFGDETEKIPYLATKKQLLINRTLIDRVALNCPCCCVSCCKSVSLCYYLTLSSVTSPLCLEFLLLFIIRLLPSTLSSLVSHHYSFSESLLSFLKYASPRVPHEVVCL